MEQEQEQEETLSKNSLSGVRFGNILNGWLYSCFFFKYTNLRNKVLIDWFDFNGMSTCLGLIHVGRLPNRVYCTLMLNLKKNILHSWL